MFIGLTKHHFIGVYPFCLSHEKDTAHLNPFKWWFVSFFRLRSVTEMLAVLARAVSITVWILYFDVSGLIFIKKKKRKRKRQGESTRQY